MFAAFFGKKKKEYTQPVVDPSTIVEPVDFYSPEFPYEQGFKEIDAYIRKLPAKGYVPVSDIARLQFYALFKQATVGDIDEKKVHQPNMFKDWEGYWKVVGWRRCKGMSKEKARDCYIELLDGYISRYSTLKWGGMEAADRWWAFRDGVMRVQNLPKNGYHLPDTLRGRVYAMYKQATIGDLKKFQKSEAAQTEKKYKWVRSRPAKAGFDQYRYDEWKKLEGLNSEQAKRLYCKELFHEAAKYGYVWDPPGTAAHMEVIGDQTSAKTFQKEDPAKIVRLADLIDDPEDLTQQIEVSGIRLSAMERVALRKYLKKERKQLEGKDVEAPMATVKKAVAAAEVLKTYAPVMTDTGSIASDAFVDANSVTGASSVGTSMILAMGGAESITPRTPISDEDMEEEAMEAATPAESAKAAAVAETPKETPKEAPAKAAKPEPAPVASPAPVAPAEPVAAKPAPAAEPTPAPKKAAAAAPAVPEKEKEVPAKKKKEQHADPEAPAAAAKNGHAKAEAKEAAPKRANGTSTSAPKKPPTKAAAPATAQKENRKVPKKVAAA